MGARGWVARGWLAAATLGASLVALSDMACAECDPTKPVGPVASRFEMHGNTVYDKSTDLTWMRCSYGQAWAEGGSCSGSVIPSCTCPDGRPFHSETGDKLLTDQAAVAGYFSERALILLRNLAALQTAA